MRPLLLLLSLTLPLSATDLRLRTGDYTTVYRIAAGTTGAAGQQPVLKVRKYDQSLTHTFNDGDVVSIQGVRGCEQINGFRKVTNSNQGAGTLKLTDESNNPIVCTYAWIDNYEGGRIGLVSTVTLNAHPRLHMLSALDSRVNGAGGPPPIVTENSIAYQSMVTRYTTGYPGTGSVFDIGCDGVTPALCPKAEAAIGSGDVTTADGMMNVALLWYANPSHTEYLATVRYWLNHIERAAGALGNYGPMNYGFPWVSIWGKGSKADWISLLLHGVGVTYSMVRGQMSSSEKTTLANKILNGLEPNTTCTYHDPINTGLTVTWAGNGTSMTASGPLAGILSPGDWAFATNANSWGTGSYGWGLITSVSGSTATFDPSYQPAVAITAKQLYRAPGDPIAFQDWADNRCGLSAIASNHTDNPVYATHWQLITGNTLLPTTGPAGASQTLNISDAGLLALNVPFYALTAHGEVLQFTARSGNDFTVTRGALFSNPASLPVGEKIRAMRWVTNSNPKPAYDAPGVWLSNLVLSRQNGYISIGLAFADDDSRAAQLAQDAINYYHDYTYFDMTRNRTIRTSGGNSTGYQYGRWGDMNPQIASMINSGTRINLWGGYLTRYIYNPIYLAWPGTPQSGPGQVAWNDIGPCLRQTRWLHLNQYYDNGSLEQKYARQWFYNTLGCETTGQWLSNGGYPTMFYRLLFDRPTDAVLDYTASLNPWIFATTTDNSTAAKMPNALVVSKNGWGSGVSYMHVQSNWNYFDHDAFEQKNPGNYYVAQGNAPLIADEPLAYVSGSDTGSNYMEVGGTVSNLRDGAASWNDANPSAEGGLVTFFDQTKGTSDYVYARVNYKDAWKTAMNLTRAYRYFDHLKTGTGKDYVVVFDDIAGSSANQKRTRLHYYKGDDASSTLSGGGTAAMAFKKLTQSAMVSTKLLFPGAVPTITTGTTSKTLVQTIDWGSSTSAQMVAVHRTAAGTTDVMPTVTTATTDANSVGIQVDDGNNSYGVVYPNDGVSRTSRSIVTTYAGNGQVLLHGVTPGTYTVYKDAVSYLTSQAIGTDGTLLLVANGAHTWSVGTITPPTLSIITTSLPSGSVGVAYSQTVSATGGTPPYTWSISAGALPAGLTINTSTGAISGTPGAGGTSSFTVAATDGAAVTATKPLSILVTAFNLAVSPSTITKTCTVGGSNPAPATVTVGGSLTNWAAVKTQTWMSISPTSGTSVGTLTATFNCTGLTPGARTDTITVSTTDAVPASPQTVNVTLIVSAPAATPGTKTRDVKGRGAVIR